MMSATMLLTTLRTMQHAAVDMIEMNEKNEKEETDLRAFRNVVKARGVSGTVASTRQQQQETKCSVVSTGKKTALNNHMSPRTSMAGRRVVSCVALGTRNKRRRAFFPRHSSVRGSLEEIPEERNGEKDENDVEIFQNINDADKASDAPLSPHQQETKCHIVSEGKHAAPTSHMSPRRSPRRTITGRRGSWSASSTTLDTENHGRQAFQRQTGRRGSWTASSTTLDTENHGRQAFQRQSSLRGWHEGDLKDGDSLEISAVKWIRPNDCDTRSNSEATLSPQERHVKRRILSPVKQAASNSHMIPSRSIAGRRGSWTASSTTFGPGSKDRYAFPRQSSLRGCDSGYDAALTEISKVKQTRLHDYTESPIIVL
jgi:hypothetical protein